jgi:hypothetical protein
MQTRRKPRLGKEHGAEFAGANEPDRHRISSGMALGEEGVQIHGAISELVIARSEHAGAKPTRQIEWRTGEGAPFNRSVSLWGLLLR